MTTVADISQHPFCIFSEQLYSYDKSSTVLGDLEKQLGVNANVLLFCCWVARTGQKLLSQREIRCLLEAILAWHEQIVVALTKLRKSSGTEAIKELIIPVEWRAYQVEQVMLAKAIVKNRSTRSMLQQATDAQKNIALYCKFLRINLSQTDSDMVNTLLALVFPD